MRDTGFQYGGPVNRFAILWLSFCPACGIVQSSVLPAGWPQAPLSGPVSVSATRDLPGAEELGIVEAHGIRPAAPLGEILAAFRSRVAELGGDYGRIDGFATRFEEVTESYTYDCGTNVTETQTRNVSTPGPNGTSTSRTETVTVTRHQPRTCTGTRQVEAATFTLTGRAFRAPKGVR